MFWLPLAHAAGLALPAAPGVAPGRVAVAGGDPLAAALAAEHRGDGASSARSWRAWLAEHRGSPAERAAAWFAVGVAEERRGDLAAAAAAFSGAIDGETAVAPEAAWRAARADLRRGEGRAAAERCARARGRWPSGTRRLDCLEIEGDGWILADEPERGAAAWSAWLAEAPPPAAELGELGLARATVRRDREAGVAALTELVYGHQWHPTGAAAEAELRALGEVLPDSLDSRIRRADERLRCGDRDRAWALYQALAAEPEAAAWAASRRAAFVIGTRRWKQRAADLEDEPGDEARVEAAKALGKAGDWKGAAKAFAATGREDLDLARARLLAGQWKEALATLDSLGDEEAKWLAAVVAVWTRAKDADSRLDAFAEGDHELGARYWKARRKGLVGDAGGERRALEALAAEAPTHWYGLLAQNRLQAGRRDGRWSGPPPPPPPSSSPLPVTRPALPLPAPARPRAAFHPDWRLRPTGAAPAPGEGLPLPVVHIPDEDRSGLRERIPPADLAAGRAALRALAAVGGEGAESIAAAGLFADVGLYDLAGATLQATLAVTAEELQTDPVPELHLGGSDWMRIFLYTEDAWDGLRAAKTILGRARLGQAGDPWVDADAVRLARLGLHPTPWLEALGRYGAVADVDPLLSLAIMRQESTFRPDARSWVGALGLIQVMPRTGARIATLLDLPRYSPDDLVEPETNLRFGTWYLGRLLDRYGSVPLAVASYNGGPHNVASWLGTWPQGLDTDLFVELIPFPETRDYVERVTGWYAEALSRYGPEGAVVAIPPQARDLHPEGIDF